MSRRAVLVELIALARSGGAVDDVLAGQALAEQVAPLLGARLASGRLTASGRAQAMLAGAHLGEVTRARARATLLGQIRAALGALPVLALKGTALERTLYAPGERAMADLDLLVARSDLAAATAALVAAGAVERQHRALLARLGLGHECTLDWQGQTIDLHAEVAPWPLWQVRTAELLRHPVLASDGIAVPSREDLLVTLGLHAAQDGYALAGRHLVDAAFLVDDPALEPLTAAAIAHAFGAARPTAIFVHLGLALGGRAPRWQAALASLDPHGVAAQHAARLPLPPPRPRRGLELEARLALLRSHERPLRPLLFLAYRGLLRAADGLLGNAEA